MNKVVMIGALCGGALLAGCSSSSASVAPEEQLAVHMGERCEMHEMLDALEGEFEAVSHYWMRPNSRARLATGRCTGSWDESGLAMGQSYEGELFEQPVQMTFDLAWDEIRGCFVGGWTRGAGGSVMTLSDGHADAEGCIVTMRCDGETSTREVLSIDGPDRHTRELYRTDAYGQEYLSWRMEMVRVQD